MKKVWVGDCCLLCDFKSGGHGFNPYPCFNYFVLAFTGTELGLSSDSDRTELGLSSDSDWTELGLSSDSDRTELGLLGLVGECKVLCYPITALCWFV